MTRLPEKFVPISLFTGNKLSTRCFLWLRSVLTPYELIASTLPPQGRLLDLGSGHGLLSFALSLGSHQREIVGIDHDPERVRLAEAAALRLLSVNKPRFYVGDLREKIGTFPSGTFAGVAMIDILHYFDPASQQFLIGEAARLLAPDGVLVMREIDAGAGIKAAANRLYERLVTGVGFTRSVERTLSFRGAREWTNVLEGAGFSVRSDTSGPPFLADVLFTARRNL